MWEDKFIDILMIILDHSPLYSSTAIQHSLVSSRDGVSHLSGNRDLSVTTEAPKSNSTIVLVSQHNLQEGMLVPVGAGDI